MHVRVLLLQARRPDDPCKGEEHLSFAQKTGLEPDRISCHDLLEGAPTLSQVRSFDALMIGGSGDYSIALGNLPHFNRLADVLCEVCEVGHPTFASCFGFHCMVAALGGEIIHDPDNTEVGTYPLQLTESGIKDPVLGELPTQFNAQLGHKDRAAVFPPGIPNLASSALSPYQALKIPGRPVWASQFHPELDAETNKGRFLNYIEGYAARMNEQERARALAHFKESPETGTLLKRFLNLIFA